ncbi:MAG: hypothetical protein IPI39_26240 [Candidatus Obscuribacter sp.]|nr:hypothetical protein [Candidatus Obscuribacter sp.]
MCAQKLCQNERLVRYLDAQYDIASRCGKDWVSSADATVLARWLEDNGHELHIWELSRFLSFAEIARLSQAQWPLLNGIPMYVQLARAWHWYSLVSRVAFSLAKGGGLSQGLYGF